VFNLSALNLLLDITGLQTLNEYVIADAPVGSPLITGTQFASVANLPFGASIDYDGTAINPNSIVLIAAIPEPASLAGLLAVSAINLRRRQAVA